LLMTYAMAFYGLVWAARQKDWKIAFRIGIGMGIGLILASIYLLPAALETKDIQEHFTAIFPYHRSYLTLMPGDDYANVVNLSFVFQTLTVIVAAIILRPSALPDENRVAQKDQSSQTRIWLLMAAVTTFMCTSFSIYISKLLPKIQVATF